MIVIKYPEQKPAIKTEAGKEKIFCLIRKKWVLLTPEEWVRQNFLLHLIETLHYPAPLIAVEKKLLAGQRQRRYDIVVHNKNAAPQMVIECKEMNVPLNLPVLEQVLRYNLSLQAPYFVITNGLYCFGYKKSDDQFEALAELPAWL